MHEPTAQPFREQSVRAQAIARHPQVVDRVRVQPRSHEFGHRVVGFARDDRLHAAGRGHRGENGAAARNHAAVRRVGGVRIGADEPGALAHQTGQHVQPLVVELPVKPDHHVGHILGCCRFRHDRLDRDRRRTHRLDRLDHPGTAVYHDTRTLPQEVRCSHRRGEQTTGSIDADGRERLLLCAHGGVRVVRDEHQLMSGVDPPAYGLDGPRQRPSHEPNDAVHVTENRPAGWHTVIVPRFEPFAALRYADQSRLGDLCAPPYDVQSDKDRERFGLRDRYNIVHVDMPIGADGGHGRYEDARTLLDEWRASGILVRDDRPSFTLYRMHFTDALGRRRTTVGVIGALEVVDEGAGGVLPHERTTPKAKTDRLELTRATECNLSPVWGLSLAGGLTDLLREPGHVVGSYTDGLGVRHAVERVDDPARIAGIAAAVSSQPVVIADGHHRYAISRTYRDEVRIATGRTTAAAELTMTYVNELVDEQLSVAAIHRLYSEVSADDLMSALERHFSFGSREPVDERVLSDMERSGTLVLLFADLSGISLTPRDGAFAGVRDLDSARLEHALASTAHTVHYQHGFHEMSQALQDDAYVAGILIRPVSVDEIRRTAHEGLLMPPKSTFFTPKLQTGLVVRELS